MNPFRSRTLSDTSFPSPSASLSFLYLPLSCLFLCFPVASSLPVLVFVPLFCLSTCLSLPVSDTFFLYLPHSVSYSVSESLCNLCVSMCRSLSLSPPLSLCLTLYVGDSPFVSESLVFVCACPSSLPRCFLSLLSLLLPVSCL